MARPSKAVGALNRHATKEELNIRSMAEKSLLTGQSMTEQPKVAGDPIAHAEFERLLPILTAIGKNDALYENIINRYCLLRAECEEFQRLKERFSENLAALDDDEDLEAPAKYRLQAAMQKSILDADGRVQTKRKMMFDIEKECAMTVASAMRSVPKAPTEPKNPLLELVGGG